MKKLISTIVLTVAVFGTSFAEETQVLQSVQGPRLRLGMQTDMDGSVLLGAGKSKLSGATSAALTRVKSREDLRATSDSDDEEGEVQQKIQRQNSQEDLSEKAQAPAQSSGFWAKCSGFIVSVVSGVWNTIKSWIW